MKKALIKILTIIVLPSPLAFSQVVSDVVSLGTGYPNQAFYSLENDEIGQIPKNSWDVCFEVSSLGSGIRINGANQLKLWHYPNGNNTDFGNALDTTGLSNWAELINSDTSWSRGAFNQTSNPSNPFDLGWGIYNTVTHSVAGNSLFILSDENGDYIQVDIIELISGEFRFRYANLDGSQAVTDTIRKADYPGKNFGYYKFETQSALDLEPSQSEDWDLLFTQYVTYVGPNVPFGVSGVLSNSEVQVAKVAENPDAENYQNWFGKTYSTEINTIGYNWKDLNYTTFQFDVEDSLLYFVKTTSGDVWKIIFTAFGGSSTGNYEFTKQRLSTASIESEEFGEATLTVYPNPNSGGPINILLDIPNVNKHVNLKVIDLSGRLVLADVLENEGGLTQHQLSSNQLKPGIYLVQIDYNGHSISQKLILQ